MRFRFLLPLAAALLFATNASATMIAATVSGPPEGSDGDSNGWRFEALANITLEELGVWNNGVGLPSAVDVGIWTDAGSLLGSLEVGAGTSGRAEGGFWFEALASSIDLISGAFYRVAAKPQSGRLPWVAIGGSQSFSAEIGYDNGYYSGGSSLQFPTLASASGLGFFGANFTYDVTAVPEPTTLALLSLGLAGLGIARRKKRA